jgi:hypothetical protein
MGWDAPPGHLPRGHILPAEEAVRLWTTLRVDTQATQPYYRLIGADVSAQPCARRYDGMAHTKMRDRGMAPFMAPTRAPFIYLDSLLSRVCPLTTTFHATVALACCRAAI